MNKIKKHICIICIYLVYSILSNLKNFNLYIYKIKLNKNVK